MKLLPYIALSTAVLCAAASAAPAGAASPTATDSAAVSAAEAGWGLAYEVDPKTGRSALMGFGGPDGQVVPFAVGQQGYTADPRTGELTTLIPGQAPPAALADTPGQPQYLAGR